MINVMCIEKCSECGKEFIRGLFPVKLCEQCSIKKPLVVWCLKNGEAVKIDNAHLENCE